MHGFWALLHIKWSTTLCYVMLCGNIKEHYQIDKQNICISFHTFCHYIFSADATRKLCLFTGFLVFFNVFCVLVFISVISLLLRVFLYLLPLLVCYTILHFSLLLSADFYTRLNLKVHIYLM